LTWVLSSKSLSSHIANQLKLLYLSFRSFWFPKPIQINFSSTEYAFCVITSYIYLFTQNC